MGYFIVSYRKYLKRFSLQVSGYVALADMINSILQIVMLQNSVMTKLSAHGLRFILWLTMFSTLLFVFLTFAISLQLHLSTLTQVRVRVYMRLEKFYVPICVALATVLPAIVVGQTEGMYWESNMHSFAWPAPTWKRRLLLWACNYAWLVVTIVYCTGITLCLGLRVLSMWRNSVEVTLAPRPPEKWDWSTITQAGRDDMETIAETSTLRTTRSMGTLNIGESTSDLASLNLPAEPPHSAASNMTFIETKGRRVQRSENVGYLLPVRSSPQAGKQRVQAVRSFVDKKRFLKSIQRLACYPLVPIITQLGVVAMNIAPEPSKGLYIYGTLMATTSGFLNFLVFTLNPALSDIWKESAAKDKAAQT
ncbi:hypothetical protein EC988_003153 [Linderina pennispora]|nr:hypothetical protein EC988_003153 [Linderina pennispora]